MTDTARRATRPYRSRLRDDSARQTRDRVVAAAGKLFVEQGFGATTIDEIARLADVSRKTVFDAVGGKLELIKQAVDVAIVGDGEPIAMIDRPVIQALIAEPDPRRMLTGYAHHVAQVMTRTHGIIGALKGAASSDPGAADLYEQHLEQRRTGMRGPAGQLARQGALRPDLTEVEAADLLFVLIDPLLYELLVGRQGWTVERFERWLAETMIDQLLEVRTA